MTATRSVSLNLAGIVVEGERRAADSTALICGATRLTWRQLHERVRRFAGALSSLGVTRGRHVALLLPNVPEFTIACFAAHYVGAPVVPLNVLLTADEIHHHLEDSGAVALVAWRACGKTAREAAARCGTMERLILAGDGPPDGGAAPGSPDMAALIAAARAVRDPAATSPDDTAVLIYTSGTTGRPKGAELTHAGLHANAACVARLHHLGPGTVGLAALPLFHSFGQTVMQNAVLMGGGCVVLMPRFEAGAALELMARHGVTFFAGVPTMYHALLHHQGAGPRGTIRLERCMSGGAPMPAEVMRAFEQRFHVAILESYGLSETSPVATSNRSPEERRPGSIGLPIEGVELRLVDDRGAVIEGPGIPGEICIRGHNVMKGYYRRPEATREAIPDGWLRTGDVAVRDEQGYYTIVDRKKDIILRGGYTVYPREIEEILYSHPAVLEAAVVGIPHERQGEEIKAVVVPRPGTDPSEGAIIAWCRRRLAAYKYPRRVEFRSALPRGPTGKILKRQLR